MKEGVTGFSWSPDGRRIAFLSIDSLPKTTKTARKRRDDAQVYEGDFRLSHVWVIDLGTKKATELVHTTQFTVRGAPDWSPDGKRIAYVTTPSTLLRDERRNAFIVDATTGAAERINSETDVQNTPVWSPDGRTLALVTLRQTHPMVPDSMPWREILDSHLVLYDVAAKTGRDASAGFDNSPGAVKWSADGKSLYFTAGDRVYSSVFRFDVASGKYSAAHAEADHPWLVVRQERYADGDADRHADVAGRRLLVGCDLCVAEASSRTPIRSWQTSRWARAKSSPGRARTAQQVEGVLLKPVGYRAGSDIRCSSTSHGGPTGAHNTGFKANWGSPGQFWAGQGWAVLYPNPRGSTGYGEKFMRGNIMDWGGGDYRDIMTRRRRDGRARHRRLDKLAFEGWSYGGYMTAWVVTQTSRFKAAMDGAGLSDLVEHVRNDGYPGYIGSFFKRRADTKRRLDFYRPRSAITFVDNVTTPLLILHGGNDQRVPIGQSMEYYPRAQGSRQDGAAGVLSARGTRLQ